MISPYKKPPAPLASVAIWVIAGIILGRYVPTTLALWMLAGGVALMAAMALTRQPHLATPAKLALAAAIGLFSAANTAATLDRLGEGHILTYCQGSSWRLATVTGRVATVPQLDAEPIGTDFSAYRPPARTRFLLDAEGVSTEAGEAECEGLISVRVDGPVWGISAGTRVSIQGRLTRPRGATNPGEFDWQAQALRSSVLVHLAAESPELVQVTTDQPRGPTQLLGRLRASAAGRLTADGQGRTPYLMRALLLGQRTNSLGPIQQSMIRSGVAHLLSISGLHLGILLSVGYFLMRWTRFAPRPAAIGTLVLLGAYLLLVEPRTPILRGAIMAAAFCLAAILGRSARTLNLLALAAIILLTIDPGELFRPGFQMSFGIVAGILMYAEPVERFLFGRWLSLRPLLVFGPTERIRRFWWRLALPWIAKLVSVAVAAYLAALPMAAYHFGVITPLAPIASILLLPLTAAALLLGFVQLLTSWIAPGLAAGLAGINSAVSGMLASTAHALGCLPLCIDLADVPAWATILLAVVIAIAVLHRRLDLARAWAAVVVLGGGAIFAATQVAPPAKGPSIVFLDVSNGSCAVLQTSSQRTFLFDAGSRSLPDPGRQILGPVFTDQHWPDPTAVFISHAELDHFNALPTWMATATPAVTFVHDRFETGAQNFDPVGRLMARLDRSHWPIRRLHRGLGVKLDKEATVTCLWPPPGETSYDELSRNDSSLVLRLDVAGTRVLLPGDIQNLGQRLLLELPHEELRADILALPHHGSYTPALAEFIEAVDPEIVIRSSGYRSTGATEQIRSLAVTRQFYSTNTSGAIGVKLEADGLIVSEYRNR